jgi:hypothetical protein
MEGNTSKKMRAFWGIAPCSLLGVDRRFRGEYCLNHQDDHPDGGGSTKPRIYMPKHYTCCERNRVEKQYYDDDGGGGGDGLPTNLHGAKPQNITVLAAVRSSNLAS